MMQMILLTWTTLPMAWNAGILLSSANWMNLEHQVDFREGCCHHHQCHQPLPTGKACHINWISEQDSQGTVIIVIIIISSSARMNLVPQNTIVGFHFHHQQHQPTTITITTSACKLISGSIAISTSIIEDILITCSQ